MKNSTVFYVSVEEQEGEQRTETFTVEAATPVQAIAHAMVEAGMNDHGVGPCYCKVYNSERVLVHETDVVGN